MILTGTLKAIENGKICHQFPRIIPPFGKASEDCLNLNVYKRFQEKTDLWPTFVWVYGGSNIMGSIEFYNGLENLPLLKDVCLVAMNYRLGMFG